MPEDKHFVRKRMLPKFLSVEKSGKYHQSCVRGGGGFEAEDAEGGWEAGKADGTPR